MENLILSQIPLSELMLLIKQAVREEIAGASLTNQVTPTKEGYLSRAEVAKSFGITLPTLGEWTKAGKLKAYRMSRRVYYKAAEIDQALKAVKT